MVLTLDALVERAAVARPDAPAVIEPKQTTSYRDLADESHRIAHILSDLGVRPGDRVALYQPKSARSIASVLGVLECGASYVPIDPNAPAERARQVLELCEVSAVFSADRPLKGLLRSSPEANRLPPLIVPKTSAEAEAGSSKVIALQTALAKASVAPLGRRFPSTELAYILYTSGSTGRPKGVAITHAQSLAFVETACETFGLGPSDVVSSHAPFNFDLSVIDLFCTLHAQAAISIVPESWLAFAAKVAEWIETSGMTVWNSVPSALIQLANHGALDKRDLSALRLVMFAGEPFPMKHLRRLAAAVTNARLMNVYGQTEANSSTYFVVDELPSDDSALLPIGRPFGNYDVLLIDDQGRSVEQPGVEGELFIRGAAVATGYFRDPERTAAAFVQNPVQADRPETVYRTGDRAIYDPQGDLIFRGRKDAAVKVRGYRVELGEIEVTAIEHPSIKECAVVPVPDDEIGHRLVIFVVAESDPIGPDELLSHLRQRLPPYMCPERVRFESSLPKGGTGKTDRKALAPLAATALREDA